MFYILSKFPVNDKFLEVSIRRDNPYTIITARIGISDDGDEKKVIAAVMESFYQEHYRERARKEAIEKVESAVEEAKQKAEEAMLVLVNGNTFAAMIAGEMIANDRNLWPDQYKGLVAFLPEAKAGDTYKDGQYIKVKDPSIPENDKKGQYVCVRLCKGSEWICNGEDILGTPNPYKNGFDIRRYEAYPRVRLGTATDTKINK